MSGQESPPGGVSLIGEDFLTSFKLYSGSAAATKQGKTITGQPFRKVAELSTHKETSNFWGAEYSAPLTRPVEKKRGSVAAFLSSLHIHAQRRWQGSGSGLLPEGIPGLGQVCEKTNCHWQPMEGVPYPFYLFQFLPTRGSDACIRIGGEPAPDTSIGWGGTVVLWDTNISG